MRTAILSLALSLGIVGYGLQTQPKTTQVLTINDVRDGDCNGMWIKFDAWSQCYVCYGEDREFVKTVGARR